MRQIESSEENCKYPFQLEYRHSPETAWLSTEGGIKGGGLGHTDGALAEVIDSHRIRLTVKGLLEGYHRLAVTVGDSL